jgi:GNAT superfamily N-acetyltransferase
MGIVIRRAGPADAGVLSLVGRASFLETYAGMLSGDDVVEFCRTAHDEALYARWLASPAHRLFLVESDRAPIGYAALMLPDVPVATGPTDVELRRIYVLSRFHGGGLGGRLLAATMDAAREAGFTRMLLCVFSLNADAISFYTRQGFAQAGVMQFRMGANAYEDLVLARPL